MIRERQIAHSAQEDSLPGVEVCLPHLGKLGLPGSMSPLSALTTLNGHDIGPLPSLNTSTVCVRHKLVSESEDIQCRTSITAHASSYENGSHARAMTSYA